MNGFCFKGDWSSILSIKKESMLVTSTIHAHNDNDATIVFMIQTNIWVHHANLGSISKCMVGLNAHSTCLSRKIFWKTFQEFSTPQNSVSALRWALYGPPNLLNTLKPFTTAWTGYNNYIHFSTQAQTDSRFILSQVHFPKRCDCSAPYSHERDLIHFLRRTLSHPLLSKKSESCSGESKSVHTGTSIM